MSNTAHITEKSTYRSFVYHKLTSLNPKWSEQNGYIVASSFKDSDTEISTAQRLALCDFNHLQRIGLKGIGTCEWLKSQNIIVPEKLNHAVIYDNYVIARLGVNEVFIIDSLKYQTNITTKIEDQWHQDTSQKTKMCGFIIPLQHSHACFSITGKYAYKMFSKLCSVDLRVKIFANHMIVQTLLAHLSVIIIRHDLKSLNHYFLLCESASAEYCWDCLLDAMHEFNGKIIGTDTLKALSI